MSITLPSIETLRELLKLVETREALSLQIEQINQKMEAAINRTTASSAPVKKAKRGRAARRSSHPERPVEITEKASKAPRGSLKSRVVEVLEAAGSAGITVKDIATTLGLKSQNIHIWFSGTGKKDPRVIKVGPARYAFKQPEAAPAPVN